MSRVTEQSRPHRHPGVRSRAREPLPVGQPHHHCAADRHRHLPPRHPRRDRGPGPGSGRQGGPCGVPGGHRAAGALPGADHLLPHRQARRRGLRRPPAARLPDDPQPRHRARLLGRRDLGAQGGAGLRLGRPERGEGRRPGPGQAVHDLAVQDRPVRQPLRDGPPARHPVRDLEPAHLGLVRRRLGLAQVHRRQLAPRPRAHLVHLGRRAQEDLVLDRQGRQRAGRPAALELPDPDPDPHADHLAHVDGDPAAAGAGATGHAARRARP